MQKTRILMTGFDAFDGEPVNAAWEIVRAVAAVEMPGVELMIRQIPTVFCTSLLELKQAVDEVDPDVILCVGQAGGRSAISVERIGVNLDDARIPDNAGQQPRETPIVENGPAAYWSGLPVRDLVNHLRSAGIPAEESWSAGNFVCNHVFYGLMHTLAQASASDRKRQPIGGFIHVPYLPEQAARHQNAPSLGRAEMERALRMTVEYLGA